MPTLRLSDLADEAQRHGFTVMNATYGRLPSKQCEDLLSMDPATPVIRIHVPTASGSETHRSFVVVSHEGEVTHIEARYSFEPPSPSVIDHMLKALGLA